MKYKFLNKALLGAMLLISVGASNAGQTGKPGVDQSFFKSPALNKLTWVDENKQPFTDFRVPLELEEGIKRKFYLALYKYTAGTTEEINQRTNTFADLNIREANNTIINDIMVNDNANNRCKFNLDEVTDPKSQKSYKGLFCEYTLTATKNAPLYGPQRFANHSSVAMDNQGFDFADGSKGLYVNPYNESGTISVIDATGKPNKISALAVSKNHDDDKINIRLRVTGATDSSHAYLQFKSTDETVAKLDKNNCDFKIENASGYCDINLIPIRPGNVAINFSGSQYVRNNGNTDRYTYRKLPQVKVSIGTLYAGYMNGDVYRQGSNVQNLTPNTPVRSLAMDSKNHILYAINGSSVYAQYDSIMNLNLKKTIDIGNNSSKLQALTLSNTDNEVLVGNGYGEFYKAVGDKATLLNDKNNFGSIFSSYIDQTTNIVYLTDEDNSIGVYKENAETKKYELKKYDVHQNSISNILVAANNNVVFVATDIYPQSVRQSFLYNFVVKNGKGELLPVDIDKDANPFNDTKITNLFFADMDEFRSQLYAASDDGKLYRLDQTSQPNKWIERANLGFNHEIEDVVVDNLGNIYLSANKSVWRIKYNEVIPTKLTSYDSPTGSPVRSLVVDNNEVREIESITLKASDTAVNSKNYPVKINYEIINNIQVPRISGQLRYFVVAPWMNAESTTNPLRETSWSERYEQGNNKSFTVTAINENNGKQYDVVVDAYMDGMACGIYYSMNAGYACLAQDSMYLVTKIISSKNASLPAGHYKGTTDLLVKYWPNDGASGVVKVNIDWNK